MGTYSSEGAFICFKCGLHKTKHPDSRRICVDCFDDSTDEVRRERQKRSYNLSKKFGISIETYESLLDRQGGVCAICFSPPKKRRLAVDHCHGSGMVRGLLCARCNQGVGYFADDPVRMERAAQYCREAESQTLPQELVPMPKTIGET